VCCSFFPFTSPLMILNCYSEVQKTTWRKQYCWEASIGEQLHLWNVEFTELTTVTLRELCSVELSNLHVSSFGDMRNAQDILVGKPEGKRPLGRPKRR
jgi:hypothetical protein